MSPTALKEISQKPNVKAIILRVDSPGGTTTMSDTIWRWVRVNQNLGKKVYISLGNVAASGGYYIASPGDLIIAQPGTLPSLSHSLMQFFFSFTVLSVFLTDSVNLFSSRNAHWKYWR
jgi:hypothetical protein